MSGPIDPFLSRMSGEAAAREATGFDAVPPWADVVRGVVADQPRVRLREILAVACIVALADATLYRGGGFAGAALFFSLGPALLVIGEIRFQATAAVWLVGGMLAALSARLLWLGSPLAIAVGVALVMAFALAMRGRAPFVRRILVMPFAMLAGGARGLVLYAAWLARFGGRGPRLARLDLILPVAAVAVFGGLFVLANPDVSHWMSESLRQFTIEARRWLVNVADHWGEIAFWLAVAWGAIGLLRPALAGIPHEAERESGPTSRAAATTGAESPHHAAIRNTLLAVIALFAAYLAFEFATLWFRQFPKGFYYAGYAHQGAAWLTVALALATAVLSLVFRADAPRDARMRRLGWIWSVQNLLLALAVYNRLHIYIDFNGMTRMRMVGLFGVTTVVVGFCLVLWKIVANRGFGWLVERQLWALAIAVFLFAVTPVDMIAHAYNTRCILRGDLAPSVQITEHPVNTEGALMLEPLMNAPDAIIARGVRAMLAGRYVPPDVAAARRDQLGWTSYQLADETLRARLDATRGDWQEFLDPMKRDEAIKAFREYAYQWY